MPYKFVKAEYAEPRDRFDLSGNTCIIIQVKEILGQIMIAFVLERDPLREKNVLVVPHNFTLHTWGD